jgi:putative Ca2+/H+ antiporter (TMEM165/GDT1 family)
MPLTSTVDSLLAIFSTFGLIFLAEIGDKSQLVCMTLAARYRHTPVLLGSIAAFLVLNTLAVAFGAGLAEWIPDYILASAVAILFGVFGVKLLLTREEDEDVEKSPITVSLLRHS